MHSYKSVCHVPPRVAEVVLHVVVDDVHEFSAQQIAAIAAAHELTTYTISTDGNLQSVEATAQQRTCGFG